MTANDSKWLHSGQLEYGPHRGWLGYYSLASQGVTIENFESYIRDNSPLTFIDPEADPYICGTEAMQWCHVVSGSQQGTVPGSSQGLEMRGLGFDTVFAIHVICV